MNKIYLKYNKSTKVSVCKNEKLNIKEGNNNYVLVHMNLKVYNFQCYEIINSLHSHTHTHIRTENGECENQNHRCRSASWWCDSATQCRFPYTYNKHNYCLYIMHTQTNLMRLCVKSNGIQLQFYSERMSRWVYVCVSQPIGLNQWS